MLVNATDTQVNGGQPGVGAVRYGLSGQPISLMTSPATCSAAGSVFGGRIGEGRRVVFFRHLDMPARKTRVRELTKNENLERMSIL